MPTTTGYNTIPVGLSGSEMLDSRPLFGETSQRKRMIDWGIAIGTLLFIMITFICSFIFPTAGIRGANVFFSICITLMGISHLLLIHWYRQGDLDPKFLRMIYFNTIMLNLSCVAANLFIHEV